MTRKDKVCKKVTGSTHLIVTLKEGGQNSPLPFVAPCCYVTEKEARMGPTDCALQSLTVLI